MKGKRELVAFPLLREEESEMFGDGGKGMGYVYL